MRIAFLISCINSKSKGSGGHYYSSLTIANSLLEAGHEIKIIVLGNQFPKAYSNEDKLKFEFIQVNLFSIYKSKKHALKKINEFNPEIIHSYDRLAYYWGRTISRALDLPSFLTKCGGPNDKYFPICENTVFFSKENLDFYRKRQKYSSVKMMLIPNRVQPFTDDIKRIKDLSSKLFNNITPNQYKMLRICRIGEYYKSSALQSINLNKKINSSGIDCSLTFIGVVQDEKVLMELKGKSDDKVFFITEDYFTKNAKELINLFDIVIGAGRSLMEATYKKKIVLTPAKNSDIPALISTLTFNYALGRNFSERVVFEKEIIIKSFEKLLLLLKSEEDKRDYEKDIFDIFLNFFDAKNATVTYEKEYKEATKKNEILFLDSSLNFLLLLKTFVVK